VLSGLDFIDAKVAEGFIGILSMKFLKCPVGSLGDVEGFDLRFNI
jgi:hypothetical protein